MNTSTECERIRMTLMAVLDGESGPPSAADQEHLATCPGCQRWRDELQAMTARLEDLPYPTSGGDLWSTLEARVAPAEPSSRGRLVWPMVAIAVAWRALQLFLELPAPTLHALVPLAVMAAALWLVSGNLLAIRTSVPELQKGGI